MHKIFSVKTKNIDEKTFNKLLTLLPYNEKQRILNFKNKKSAANSLVAALLVRFALKKVFGLSFDEIKIIRPLNQKPYIADIQNVHFNISHSDEFVVCIVSDKPVGIDVQKIKPVPFSVINRVCSEAETKKISSDSDFIKLWTKKEAVVKKKGTGILDVEIKYCTETEETCSIKYDNYWISYTL